MAYLACSIDGDVTVKAMANYLDKAERTIRDYIKEFSEEYKNDRGIVRKITENE